MWRFYWTLVRTAPSMLWQAGERLRTLIAMATFWLLVFNRPAIGMTIWDSWHGISPWWCLVPLGWLVGHGLLRANYENFAALEKRVREQDGQEIVDRRRRELGNLLDSLVVAADQLYAEPTSSTAHPG